MHMVAAARLAPRRRNSCSRAVLIRAPEQPSGWPIATGEADVGLAGRDRPGGIGDGLHPRAAEPVDRRAGDAHRQLLATSRHDEITCGPGPAAEPGPGDIVRPRRVSRGWGIRARTGRCPWP